MERLIAVMQQLSLARDLDGVMAIVCTAARELTGADGATFILRDGDQCRYADENSIAPLWKGRRFPMARCIGGWSMTHRRPAAIDDVYTDQRVPAEMYRPTFVKSLLVVPIRTVDPVGAVGSYWAEKHTPTEEETKLLHALAEATAVTMENITAYGELEQSVRERTAELETANGDFDRFCHSISHDLRAPVRAIAGFSTLIARDHAGNIDTEMRRKLDVIKSEATRMGTLIEDLLAFSRIGRKPLRLADIDMADVVRRVLLRREQDSGDARLELRVAPLPHASADASALEQVWTNLISNAVKFSAGRERPLVEIGGRDDGDRLVYFIRDNGIGFEQKHAERILEPFQKLHSDTEFPGSGMGLALVDRIVARHGGRVWSEGEPEAGATFYFSLPRKPAAPRPAA